jgi:hypothetical protein
MISLAPRICYFLFPISELPRFCSEIAQAGQWDDGNSTWEAYLVDRFAETVQLGEHICWSRDRNL